MKAALAGPFVWSGHVVYVRGSRMNVVLSFICSSSYIYSSLHLLLWEKVIEPQIITLLTYKTLNLARGEQDGSRRSLRSFC